MAHFACVTQWFSTLPSIPVVYLTVKQCGQLSFITVLVLLLCYSGVKGTISLSKLENKSERAIYFFKKKIGEHVFLTTIEQDTACSVCKPNVCDRKMQSKIFL